MLCCGSAIKSSLSGGQGALGIVGAILGVFLIATHGSIDSLALSPEALIIAYYQQFLMLITVLNLLKC